MDGLGIHLNPLCWRDQPAPPFYASTATAFDLTLAERAEWAEPGRVERSAAVEGPCVEWDGARQAQGYGMTRTKSSGRKLLRAHRVKFEEAFGPIPGGLQVLHRCDNPPCVSPDHLFLGTREDNTRDMKTKGRYSRVTGPGESNGNARLTEEEVLEIRARFSRGEVGNRLAKEFGVSAKLIYLIRDREVWAHLLDETVA